MVVDGARCPVRLLGVVGIRTPGARPWRHQVQLRQLPPLCAHSLAAVTESALQNIPAGESRIATRPDFPLIPFRRTASRSGSGATSWT